MGRKAISRIHSPLVRGLFRKSQPVGSYFKSSVKLPLLLSAAMILALVAVPHSSVSLSQTGQVFERSGNFKQDVLDWVANEYLPKDQNGYKVPTRQELDVWRQAIAALQSGSLTTALSLVQSIAPSYQVIRFTDTTANPPHPYYLLLEARVTADDIFPYASTGWGAYIYDPAPERDLAISIPHIKADANTEYEGVEAFITLRARALLLFTSHRCASNTVSPCDGSTTCSGGTIRVSDAAHGGSAADPTVSNPFEVAHEELVRLNPATVVLQFHGNGSCSTADFVISNGGNDFHVIPDGNVARLRQSLGGVSSRIQVCDHRPGTNECDLCGATNQQARFINGATTNPCQIDAPAPTTVERFIHIEQNSTMRQAANRQRIIDAIAHTTFVYPSSGGWNCSTGWYITGYFTPIETDYSGVTSSVYVEGVGTYSFYNTFLTTIQTEGWGKTRFGWYLGYYSNSWHKSNAPLDSAGNALVDGTIATDPAVIGAGATVKIPTLPSPWGSKLYTARDVGGGITGKHIDVYCGEGSAAEQETFRITGQDNQVCYQPQ
jgi:3D (Asp-Asp-Asp) domain-containing protein